MGGKRRTAQEVLASGYAMESWTSSKRRWEPMHEGAAPRVWRPRATAAEAIARCEAWTGGIGIPAMQVVHVATGNVVWRDSRQYPDAGPCIGIVTAEDADELEMLPGPDDGNGNTEYGPGGIDRCAVRRVEDRDSYEDVWACVCGCEYVTYLAGRTVCFVRIVGDGYVYGQVDTCDSCGRDLAETYARPRMQETLF